MEQYQKDSEYRELWHEAVDRIETLQVALKMAIKALGVPEEATSLPESQAELGTTDILSTINTVIELGNDIGTGRPDVDNVIRKIRDMQKQIMFAAGAILVQETEHALDILLSGKQPWKAYKSDLSDAMRYYSEQQKEAQWRQMMHEQNQIVNGPGYATGTSLKPQSAGGMLDAQSAGLGISADTLRRILGNGGS